jgi:hypothetical protein
MDFVVTEAGIHAVSDAVMERISSEQCRERVRRLCEQRGLPRQKTASSSAYASPPCYAGEFPGYFGEDDVKK